MFESLYQIIANELATNDVFAGLVGGSLLMTLLYSLRDVPKRLYNGFIFHFTVDTTIHSSNAEIFYWLKAWLSNTNYSGSARRLAITSLKHNEANVPWMLVPGYGTHYLFYRGHFMAITLEIGDPSIDMHGNLNEFIHVRSLGRSKMALDKVLDAMNTMMQSKDDHLIKIYLWDDGYWPLVHKKKPRRLDSVVMDRPAKNSLLADMKRFIGASQWYADRGIPYRRGYLLSGPAGTGKTSLVHALASELGMAVASLNMGTLDKDSELQSAFLNLPRNSIILIEDVDACHTKRESANGSRGSKKGKIKIKKAKKVSHKVSLSCLLNVIDGIGSADGRVLIMTTNYPENVDYALFRPGRVDYKMHIGHLTGVLGQELFDRYYGEDTLADVSDIVEGRTAAEIQGAFLRNINDPHAALIELDALSFKPPEDDPPATPVQARIRFRGEDDEGPPDDGGEPDRNPRRKGWRNMGQKDVRADDGC